MIYPTCSDILRCVDQALLEASDESASRMSVKSVLATSRHIIRHAEVRLRLERSILLDDIDKTVQLLQKLSTYLGTAGSEHSPIVHDIHQALNETPTLLSAGEQEMDNIVARALALRELIYVALARLQQFSSAQKAQDAYRALRDQIRIYMQYQIVQESKLIQPAFAGMGPRR